MKAILLVCCSVLTVVLTLKSDNIDILEPIMRPSPELGEAAEDLFGYTLVLHQLDVAGGVDNTR